jgi:3-hydroxyisobutyrate dehydrogenase-like beta-hydroxyacid dehydrogenase
VLHHQFVWFLLLQTSLTSWLEYSQDRDMMKRRSKMSEVTVIGLGKMGSALAGALLRGGKQVTVWNRSRNKIEPLAKEGAEPAQDPAAAIKASPIVLISVTDYQATYDILSNPEAAPHFTNRVLVQLSAGTPQEARDLEHWAKEKGASLLVGDIEVYPEQIGTPEAGIFFSGEEETYQRCEPLLRTIAGNLTYMGEAIGTANVLGLAIGSGMYGVLLSALHSARICQVEGIDVKEVTGMLAEYLPYLGETVQELGERIQEKRYGQTQASLEIYAGGAEVLLQHARESRIDSAFPKYVHHTLQQGIDAGLGSEDLAALIEVLDGSRT